MIFQDISLKQFLGWQLWEYIWYNITWISGCADLINKFMWSHNVLVYMPGLLHYEFPPKTTHTYHAIFVSCYSQPHHISSWFWPFRSLYLLNNWCFHCHYLLTSLQALLAPLQSLWGSSLQAFTHPHSSCCLTYQLWQGRHCCSGCQAAVQCHQPVSLCRDSSKTMGLRSWYGVHSLLI